MVTKVEVLGEHSFKLGKNMTDGKVGIKFSEPTDVFVLDAKIMRVICTDLLVLVDEVLMDSNRYPEGKLRDDDKGATTFEIKVYDGRVIIDFKKDIEWVGMQPDQARQLAETLIEIADKADNLGTITLPEVH